MWGAKGNICGLIFGKDDFRIPVRHKRGALYNDPVLRSVMVHLQAQLRPGRDDDSLDLEAIAGINAFVGSPGARDTAMRD